MGEQKQFHSELKLLMDEYVNLVYDYTNGFPKDELFGVTSQIRRSSLSVILNYISYKRNYLDEEKYKKLSELSERIEAMLWGIIRKL